MPEPARGFTVADVAARLRVSRDKVRTWVRKGELSAVNVAAVLSARPQLRITAEGLAAFEKARSAAPAPTAPRGRRKAPVYDFYPD